MHLLSRSVSSQYSLYGIQRELDCVETGIAGRYALARHLLHNGFLPLPLCLRPHLPPAYYRSDANLLRHTSPGNAFGFSFGCGLEMPKALQAMWSNEFNSVEPHQPSPRDNKRLGSRCRQTPKLLHRKQCPDRGLKDLLSRSSERNRDSQAPTSMQ